MAVEVPAPAAFFADRNTGGGRGFADGSRQSGGSSGGHGRGDSNSGNKTGGSIPGNFNGNNADPQFKKPYTPKCQICRGTHYANHCPSRYARDSPSQVANLARRLRPVALSPSQCSPIGTWIRVRLLT